MENSQPTTLPDTACCLGCGYLLRGLQQPICPECGRVFDPRDKKSFASNRTDRLLRRKALKAVVLVFGLAIIIGFIPRGILKGRITIDCQCCGEKITLERWEPKAPKWIGRYPGFSRVKNHELAGSHAAHQSRVAGFGQDPTGINLPDIFIQLKLDGYGDKSFSKPIAFTARGINGVEAIPENAHTILKPLMNPLSRGLTLHHGGLLSPARED